MSNFTGFHATIVDNTTIITAINDSIYTIDKALYLSQLLYGFADTNCVVYDLDQLAACILHAIGITKEQGKYLLSKESRGRLNVEDYRIVYFPKAFFLIQYGKWQISFQNMAQDEYFKTAYTEDNSVEDAVKKAKAARDIAIEVSKALEYFGLETDRVSSPIKAFLSKYKLGWPTYNDCPDEITELAWKSLKGHWFEVFSIGKFDNAYLYDINGSYAYELASIPDTRKGKFIKSKVPPDNTKLGIAEGILETEAQFHPFLIKIGKNNYTPTGKIPNVLGLRAVKLLQQYKELGTFNIERGYWWIPTEPLQYCYRPRMEWLWNKKQATDDATTRAIATRLYSALWGLQSQYLPDKDIFGDNFNAFINYTVEENSRLHVARANMEQKVIPLAIIGDGFISDIERRIENPKNVLGGWKLSKQGKCIIAGTNNICFESNEPPKGLVLHYNTLLQQMKDSPKATKYTRDKYHAITLPLALQAGFDKLGTIQKVERSTIIGSNYSRIFLDRPETGKDLLSGKVYQSQPWDYGILTTKKEVIQEY